MPINAPQQLNMADRQAIRPTLVPRCTQAVAEIALYILNGGKDADPNVVNLKSWAKGAIDSAGQWAEKLSWHVMNQGSFLNGGSAIDDAELKGVIETALVAHYVPQA